MSITVCTFKEGMLRGKRIFIVLRLFLVALRLFIKHYHA